ncbi:MAG: adenylosuccinate lyase [bacterium]
MSDSLKSISVHDGRYRKHTEVLGDILSEYGLIRHRVYVEVKWLQFLSRELEIFQNARISETESIIEGFNPESARMIKSIEKTTNHDVKSVEYFIKKKLVDMGMADISEFVHFACTSEDINNTAYALMIKKARKLLCDRFLAVHSLLEEKAEKYADLSMMSRTHGQPASPTTLGKELINFAWRMRKEIKLLEILPEEAKMNGASGNFNAHYIAFPHINWHESSRKFISEYLELTPLSWTTQINPYHYISHMLHNIIRLASVVIDIDRDIWGYISLNYFKQKKKENEVGSSTMPHKINPINFENSEGNMGMAISIMEHLSTKLLNSRFQRDLTDSTVLRNLGSVFGYLFISTDNLISGLSRIDADESVIKADLEAHPELLSEAVQTVMRVFGEKNPYEKMKAMTRGKKTTMDDIRTFIDNLESVPEKVKKRLKKMTPSSYTGIASELVKSYRKEKWNS